MDKLTFISYRVSVNTTVTAANFLPEFDSILDFNGNSQSVCVGGKVIVSLHTSVEKTKSNGGIGTAFYCLGRS